MRSFRHPPSQRTYLTLDEVAETFSVSRRTVERWVHDGVIESISIGRARRVHVDAIEPAMLKLGTPS
jgi:excisionase family DNA binding protein